MPSNSKKASTDQNSGSLFIYDIELSLNIGVSELERESPQKIVVDIELNYHTLPAGAITDDENTIDCYDNIISLIKELVKDRHFKLIEHLAYSIFQHLKSNITCNKIAVSVKKHPQISGYRGMTKFSVAG